MLTLRHAKANRAIPDFLICSTQLTSQQQKNFLLMFRLTKRTNVNLNLTFFNSPQSIFFKNSEMKSATSRVILTRNSDNKEFWLLMRFSVWEFQAAQFVSLQVWRPMKGLTTLLISSQLSLLSSSQQIYFSCFRERGREDDKQRNV